MLSDNQKTKLSSERQKGEEIPIYYRRDSVLPSNAIDSYEQKYCSG